MYDVRTTCRSCDSRELDEVLSLGDMPLADALVDEKQWCRGEPRYPLNVVFCRSCCLMQIRETVSPDVLFCRDYPYYSSFSETLLQHSRENALSLIESRRLSANSLVVELASNDGYMLKNFKERSIPVLGIDPADGPARVAQAAGIPTRCEFFGEELAVRLRSEGLQADVIIANNVLAHVADLNGFVEAIAILLKQDGIAVIEMPYVKDLIERCEFDTIYHEHLCYFSVTSLASLFNRHRLTLNAVQHLPIHGGSLRLSVSPATDVGESVRGYLREEAEQHMDDIGYYRDFGTGARCVRAGLLAMLQDLKGKGHRIAAYGAAAKGATLLNFAGVDDRLVDFVVDRNVHKQGLYMPGVHIPIRDPAALLDEIPDYVLLLAWNFKDEVLRQQEAFRRRGGKWIVPIPYPAIL